jgi:hypothetical protein
LKVSENCLDYIQKMNKKTIKWGLILLMAVLPALLVTIIINTQDKVPLTNFMPVSPTDQNEYWHQVATFNVAGFNGGYYSHLENIAPIPQSRFGVHGPVYIAIMGLFSRITGWNYSTPIFFNMAFIALGFVIFAILTNLNYLQIVLAGLTLSFFTPVLLLLPTAMQESFHQMVGIVFAAIFGFSFVHQEKLDLWKKGSVIAFTFFVALIRPTWGLFFFPLFALYFPKELRKQILAFFTSLFFFALVILLLNLLITPGNNTITLAVTNNDPGFRSTIRYLIGTIQDNLQLFLTPPNIPQLVFRVEYMLIALITFVYSIILLRKKKPKLTIHNLANSDTGLNIFIFLVIVPIIFFCFSLYLMKNDLRLLAPYFLLIFFLLILRKKYPFVIAFILINILLLPASIPLFTSPIGNNFTYSKEKINSTRSIMDRSIHFDASQTNAWCNTILVPITLYDYRISLIPAGIGISYVIDNNGIDQIEFPIKSKYLLLTTRQVKDLDPGELDQLEHLADFPDSVLFINTKAICN